MNTIEIEDLMMNSEQQLAEIFEVEKAKMFLVPMKKEQLTRFDSEKGKETFDIGAGLIGETLREDRILNIPDAYNHPLYNGKVDIGRK